MNKKLFFAALASVALVACSNENEQYADFNGPVEVNFSGGVGEVLTRTTTSTDNEAWSDTHASIGITTTAVTVDGVSSSSSYMFSYYNNKYDRKSTDDSNVATFEPASDDAKIYFQKPTESVTFAAYSPYDSNVVSEAGNTSKGIITLAGSSTTDFSVTDYIWAKAENATYKENNISLGFNHVMAQLNINTAMDSDVSKNDNKITKVVVSGIKMGGTFNIEDGTTAPTDGITATDIVFESTSGETSTQKSYVVIPQTSKLVFTIYTKDKNNEENIYKYTLANDTEYAKGNSYTYTVTAKKYSLVVTGSITPWKANIASGDAYMSTASGD
jgi:hypothetical protein